MTIPATAPSGAHRGEFIPYVYGATLGRPSRGRPEKVLANPDRPESTVRLLEREPHAPGVGPARTKGCGTAAGARRHYRAGEELCPACRAAVAEDKQRRTTTRKIEEKVGDGRIDGREGRVTARNAVPDGTSRNGLPEPCGYVYRGTGRDQLTAHLGRVRLEREAQAAIPALAPADEARLTELEGELAARGVVASGSTAPKAPTPKRPRQAPAKKERRPDREEQALAAPAVAEPEPELAPVPVPEVAPVLEAATAIEGAPAAAPKPVRRCRCGYPRGSIGCRNTHGGAA